MLRYPPTKAMLPSSCMSMLIHDSGKTALAADLAAATSPNNALYVFECEES
jgi:hypothetical protein